MKSKTLERLRDERDELIADYIDAGVGRLFVNKVQYEAMGLRIERLNRVIAELEESDGQATLCRSAPLTWQAGRCRTGQILKKRDREEGGG